MILNKSVFLPSDNRVPRVGGGDPNTGKKWKELYLCSPRRRG